MAKSDKQKVNDIFGFINEFAPNSELSRGLEALNQTQRLVNKFSKSSKEKTSSKIRHKSQGAINTFIASMVNARGFARQSNYEIIFNLPSGIPTEYGRQLTLHCDTISWPGHDLQVQSRRIASEPAQQLVQSHAFAGTIAATFYLSVNHNERMILELWQQLAVDRRTHKANYYDEYTGGMEMYQLGSAAATKTHTYDERSSDRLRGGREEGYESEAYGHLNPVVTSEKTHAAVRTFGLKVDDVYPATIAVSEYGYEFANAIQKVTVEFNYRQHMPILINSGNMIPAIR